MPTSPSLARLLLGAFGPSESTSLITLPAYLQNGSPSVLDTLGVAADWTVESGGSVSDAAGGGVTFTSDSASAVIARKVVAFNAALFDTQVTLDLQAGGATSEGRQVEFTAQHVTSGTGGIRWTFTARTDLGWIRQPLNRDEATLSGATFASDIIRLRVSAALGGAGRSVTLRNLGTRPIGEPAVLLTFDDQPDTQWTAYQDVMKPRLARGTYFINYGGASPVGSGGRLTTSQLLTLVAEGNSVVNHSYTHANHTTLTEAEIHTEIDDNESAMLTAGLPAFGASTVYGTPFAAGWDSATVKTAVLSRCEFNRTGLNDPDQVLPYVEPFIVTCRVLLAPTPVSSIITAVNNAITRGTIVWFIWHSVAEAGDITMDDLTTLIDHINAQRVPMITFGDWYTLNAGTPVQVTVPW